MSSSMKPLQLYGSGGSPNPIKVWFVIEELGLPVELIKIPFEDVKKEPLISLNPNGRVPALVDPNKNITLWESGAIIDYLIAEYDPEAKLHYTSFHEKHITRCWEHFQMSGQGPYFGQKAWFTRYHPEKVQSAIDRYSNEMRRVYGVVDGHLAKQESGFLVGDRITYVDLMWLPFFYGAPSIAPEVDFSEFKNVQAWQERLLARPAVAKVKAEWDILLEQQFGIKK